MPSTSSFKDLLKESKYRLASAFSNLPKNSHHLVDMDKASEDYGKDIKSDSFKTEIGRKHGKPFASLSDDTKERFASCFFNIKAEGRKGAMSKIDWDKATNEFQPAGNIKAASFKTSVSRIMSTGTVGGKGNNPKKPAAVVQPSTKQAPRTKKRSKREPTPSSDDKNTKEASDTESPSKKEKTALASKGGKRALADPTENEAAAGHASGKAAVRTSPQIKKEESSYTSDDDDYAGAFI